MLPSWAGSHDAWWVWPHARSCVATFREGCTRSSTWSLHPQQHFPILPQLFQVIVIALIGREQVHDHVAVVYDYPAVPRLALFAPALMQLAADAFQRAIRERIQHAIAGSGADDKVVCEGGNLFD